MVVEVGALRHLRLAFALLERRLFFGGLERRHRGNVGGRLYLLLRDERLHGGLFVVGVADLHGVMDGICSKQKHEMESYDDTEKETQFHSPYVTYYSAVRRRARL